MLDGGFFKNSEIDKSLKNKKVEKNDSVKVQTANNNLTIKKNKGNQLLNSVFKLNLISIVSTRFHAHDKEFKKSNDKSCTSSKFRSKFYIEYNKLHISVYIFIS